VTSKARNKENNIDTLTEKITLLNILFQGKRQGGTIYDDREEDLEHE
jgi:hypothetical protein